MYITLYSRRAGAKALLDESTIVFSPLSTGEYNDDRESRDYGLPVDVPESVTQLTVDYMRGKLTDVS